MDARIRERLKELPQIGNLLEAPELQDLAAAYSHELVKRFCTEVISEEREAILSGAREAREEAGLIAAIQAKLAGFLQPRMKRVINATGILLHTGLGRTPLTDDIYRQAFDRVRATCNLEFDLDSGQRGDRQTHLEDLLRFVTGASGAAVVNNNAAAVLLALNTLAYRQQTLVSRGQLIEIGGSFRLPEVMRKSGTHLVEVGTTNRTYLKDYEEAIGPKTKAILVAHSSNYRIQGFVHEEDIGKISALCRKRNLYFIHDLGGGVLLDLKRWKLPREPVARHSIEAGAHAVTFSGDKILGGPQAGILIGEKETLRRIRKNPLMRALRPDKLTLALLEETLKLYLSPRYLIQSHPVLARLAESRQAALQRAQAVFERLISEGIPDGVRLEVVSTSAQLGSGALPLEEFSSAAIRIKVKNLPASQLARRLRSAEPPIIGYVRKGSVYLDVKAVMDDEIELLSATLRGLLQRII